MKTLTQPQTAIEFLNSEKQPLWIDVEQYVDTDEFFHYRHSCTHGSESFMTQEFIDWDGFCFDLTLYISFRYDTYREWETRDLPGSYSIEYSDVDVEVRINGCERWNEELEELEDYYMSDEERKQVEIYFMNNTKLL